MTNAEPSPFGTTSPLLKPLADNWWLILLRGLLAIVFGLIALIFPGIALLSFVWIFGVFAFVDGIFSIGAAITGGTMAPRWWLIIVGALSVRRHMENEWMLIAAGALSVLFGAVVLIAPGAGALALLWLIGAYAIVFGLMMVGFAFRLRTHRHAS
jgi:uncharacterized membrane protein HdeD (DUF308 family)